ncbi:unnamed protein product [Phyllotreta striolata]|uniref:Uncharacterized protein n=1 Tax=Phyllotreta striolata TaxID=444603 RepID=A0A9N9TWT3_PHYSR|nr:unnamed protein product [Phyllotreta striolata]
MVTYCTLCYRKDEDIQMNPFFKPFFEGQSLLQILNSVSSLKIEETDSTSSNICQDCTHVIINFQRLIKTYKDRESSHNSVININKKEDEFFLDEQDYDNYVECQAESFDELDESAGIPVKLVSQWKEEYSEAPSDIKIKPNKVYDEFGNEEIISRKYTCDECGDSFLYKVGFSSHMVQKHSTYIDNQDYEQYSTEITVKIPPASIETKFSRKQLPKRASATNKTLSCHICKKELVSIDELKEHQKSHKTHVCEHCGAAFTKNSYLRDHLLVHTSVKRYSCNVCGKKFKYRNGLAVHRNIHVNFRGFMCDTCGQGFNAKSTLKTHMKLKHSDERNWLCPECPLTFKVKSWLDKHYSRKHTLNRTKDFVCSMCGIAYLNKTTLTRHISEKHTGTPVRHFCTVCEKSYSMKTKLNIHMQKKHNIILNNSSSQLLL